MGDLFAGDDSDTELTFKTDTQYAKKYDTWREKEIKAKLKARYGDGDDSSSGSEEDEDGVEVTPQVEQDFFRTLSILKQDDERVYDTNYKFFADRTDDGKPKSGPAEKPLFIRDYERKRILEHDGIDVDEDAPVPRAESPSLVQEQREIVAAFKSALDSDSDDGELLARRERKPAEIVAEDKSYAAWLLGNRERLADAEAEKELKPLRDFWADPELAEGEAFLKDYILGKRYLEPGSQKAFEQAVSEEEDEKAVETMEQFERRFNFRFEHPDAALIQTFPRTMEHSVRRKDTRRKEQRLSTKERHEHRRSVQVQELMQLKALKRKEIYDRIQALKKVTGNDTLGFQDSDVEGDFDPDRHDERMRSLFAEPYYEDGAEEEEKPEFPELDDELELERWDDEGYQPQPVPEESPAEEDKPRRRRKRAKEPAVPVEEGGGEAHCEDAEFNMDADFDPTAVRQRSKEGKKRKRRVPLLSAALARKKPTFDPAVGSFDQFLDEYYALDFEDIIGDMPCRFKYRQVPANDFGLTVDEILACDDKELNMWASIKKATTLRPDWLERKDQISYARRGQNEAYKRKILTSLYQPRENAGDQEEEEDQEEERRKKKKKKAGGKKKRGLLADTKEGSRGIKEEEENGEEEVKKKKKKKHGERDELADEAEVKKEEVEERDSSLENGDVKKKKKKKKHGEKDELGDEVEVKKEEVEERDGSLENGDVKKKKKKKHREEENGERGVERDVETEKGQEIDVSLENGEMTTKKKKKKHRERENAEGVENNSKEGQESDIGLENSEVKKKKKKHREGKSDEIGGETNNDKQINETGHGQVMEKAKKRKREEECQAEDEGKEVELRNGEAKKKKAKVSEVAAGKAGLVCKVEAKKKKKKKKKKAGADGGKAAKTTVTKPEACGESAANSRRKKKNAKLQLKRQLEPKKVEQPAPKIKKPRRRDDTWRSKPVDEPAFSTSRLAAYGVKKPKKFLNYLQYKDQQ